jgi:hypothetical protein
MDENEHLASLINKDLGNPEEELIIPHSRPDRNLIREQLAIMIAHLIQTNFEKLCQAMYRLDISESKFHVVITENPAAEIPYLLADLVIEREIQKIRTREMYKRKEL